MIEYESIDISEGIDINKYRDKYINLSEEDKKRRDYMEKIDIILCLKKRG